MDNQQPKSSAECHNSTEEPSVTNDAGIFNSLVDEASTASPVEDSKQWIAAIVAANSDAASSASGPTLSDAHVNVEASIEHPAPERSYFADASNAFLKGHVAGSNFVASVAASTSAEAEDEAGYFEHGFRLLDAGVDTDASDADVMSQLQPPPPLPPQLTRPQPSPPSPAQKLPQLSLSPGARGDGSQHADGDNDRDALRTPEALQVDGAGPSDTAAEDESHGGAATAASAIQVAPKSFEQLECGLCGTIYAEAEEMALHLANAHLTQMPFIQPDQSVLTATDLQQKRAKLLTPMALVCSLRLELRVDGEPTPSCFRSHLSCQEGLSEKVIVVTTRDEDGRARPMFECRRCQRLFQNRQEALRHPDCARFKCDYCDLVCSSAGAKSQHEKKRHSTAKAAAAVLNSHQAQQQEQEQEQKQQQSSAKRLQQQPLQQQQNQAKKKASNSGRKNSRMVTVTDLTGSHQAQQQQQLQQQQQQHQMQFQHQHQLQQQQELQHHLQLQHQQLQHQQLQHQQLQHQQLQHQQLQHQQLQHQQLQHQQLQHQQLQHQQQQLQHQQQQLQQQQLQHQQLQHQQSVILQQQSGTGIETALTGQHLQLLTAAQQQQQQELHEQQQQQQQQLYEQYMQYPGMYTIQQPTYYFPTAYPYHLYDQAADTYYAATVRPSVDPDSFTASAATAADSVAGTEEAEISISDHALGQQLL